MAKVNGTGRGGKSYEDRELAASVRKLTLEEIFKVLNNPKNKLYGPVLIKLAGSVLPRLNEHTGAEGKDLFPTPILNALPSDTSTQEDTDA